MFGRPFIVRLTFEGFSLFASVLLDVVGNLRADLLLGQICYALCLVAYCPVACLLACLLAWFLLACLPAPSCARPSVRSFVLIVSC